MMDLKSVALVGGIGVIGALWQNIKAAFTYFASVFVVKIEFQYNDTGEAFLIYAWKHFKYVSLGSKRFDIWTRFVKQKSRHAQVAHQCSSQNMMFLHGWRPIFIKKEKADGGYYKSQTTLHFIRGTFDSEKLMVQIANEFDDASHRVAQGVTKFEVKRFFGKDSKATPQDENAYTKGLNSADSCKPLGYERNMLGVPSSKTPFASLSYNAEIMRFRDALVKWKSSETWYKTKGLKWRFGAGLYGPPGTGKTSFVRAVAQELDVPIHIYDLTTMSNEELTKFWGQSLAASPCIVLFEDIDRIFDENRKVLGVKEKPPLTLDCLLNLICGVEPSDGILVMVTANDMAKIDPALGVQNEDGESTRPGRLDTIVMFGALNEDCRRQIAKRILFDHPDQAEQIISEGEGETGAQFEARCANYALEAFWGKPMVYGKDDPMPTKIDPAPIAVVPAAPSVTAPTSGEIQTVNALIAEGEAFLASLPDWIKV